MIAAQAVAVGVERVAALTPTLPPATHTNSYALGERHVLLVEPATPYEDEAREWLAWARGLASAGRELQAIVVTHHHADHLGGLAHFRAELGLPVWAHERLSALAKAPIDRALEEGEALHLAGPLGTTWSVLHTPGHASDHLCFFDATHGTVVAGDMIAGTGTILIPPKDGSMIDYLAQIARLERLSAKVALPAHGDPIADPSRLFRAYAAHRAMREEWVRKAVQTKTDEAGGATLDELVPVAYADTKPELHPIAKLSLESHLVKLVVEGRVLLVDGRYKIAI